LSLNKSSEIKELRKFDVDLEFGKQWEEHIDEVFSGATKCEVKTERDKWASTGNICIEIESYGKPSGLTSTEAEVWVHNLVKDNELCCSLMFNTDKLRKVMKKMKPFTVMGGDNNASKLYLVDIAKLLKAVSQSQ
tara:strand:- start:13 stop:417 length:405 start_codon:yes stop_codon:yes gene_type:complete